MTWPTFISMLSDFVRNQYGSQGSQLADDGGMRSIVVPLYPNLAAQLREAATAERRHPRDEAVVLIEEALKARRARSPRKLTAASA